MESQLVKLSSVSSEMLFQRLLRTSEHSVPEKREKVNQENLFIIKDQASIESFKDSWPREVTSQMVMELEESLSMEKSLRMRTLT